jgi:WD40 repeat protein
MARLWDWRQGKLVTKPFEHNDEVFAAEFGPSDNWIVTGSRDRTIRLWDRHTGQPLGMPIDVGGLCYETRIVPDGTRLLTSGAGLHSHDISVLNQFRSNLSRDAIRVLGECASNRRVQESGSVHLTSDEWLDRWKKHRQTLPVELFATP